MIQKKVNIEIKTEMMRKIEKKLKDRRLYILQRKIII